MRFPPRTGSGRGPSRLPARSSATWCELLSARTVRCMHTAHITRCLGAASSPRLARYLSLRTTQGHAHLIKIREGDVPGGAGVTSPHDMLPLVLVPLVIFAACERLSP